MLLAFAAGTVANVMLRGDAMIAKHGIGMVIGSTAVALALFGTMVWLISRRRQNWARWLMLALVVVGSPQWIIVAWHAFSKQPIAGALTLIAFLLQAVANCFVFTGDARSWFRIAAKQVKPS